MTQRDRIGRVTIAAAILFTIVYCPYFIAQTYRLSQGIAVSPLAIFPAHFVGMALNFSALAFTLRDLYLRPFRDVNTKITWLLLILLTGGIGWIVYIAKYVFTPRIEPRER